MSIINAELDTSSTSSNTGRPRGGGAKRTFDVCAASLMLIFALPAMFFIAVIMFSTDRGPILFSHERIGLNGRRFRCLKFRSMVANSQEALRKHLEAFLRVTSLDELPQLFNVIRGDMSLVGPRPIVEDEVVRYAEHIDHYAAVRPGITGLWQVSGRSDVDYNQRVQLDCRYVREWSFFGDMIILIKTVKVVALRTGSG